MIIRRSPTNKEDFIMVKSEQSNKLIEFGFIPKYIDEDWIYYPKNEKISEILERSKLEND
jgi:hypothetical protein